MENEIICNCKQVTYNDIVVALHSLTSFDDVLDAFKEIQNITKCSTGCGGCYKKVLDVISKEMMGYNGIKITNSIDYLNRVYNAICGFATDYIVDLYKEKDKFDYIKINTKDTSVVDFLAGALGNSTSFVTIQASFTHPKHFAAIPANPIFSNSISFASLYIVISSKMIKPKCHTRTTSRHNSVDISIGIIYKKTDTK